MWHKEAVELAKGYDTVGLGMRARLDFWILKTSFAHLSELSVQRKRENKRDGDKEGERE